MTETITPPEARFLDLLGAELEAAAFRQMEKTSVSAPTWRDRLRIPDLPVRPVGMAVAMATLAFALVGIGILAADDPRPAAAFDIERTDTALTIDILDAVDDLDGAEAELRAAGVDASFTLVAVPPHLVDVATSALADTASAVLVHGGAGLSSIRLPASFDGTLILEIGRPARPGEGYTITTPDPAVCGELGGRRLADVAAELGAIAPKIRYLVLDAPGADAERPVTVGTDGERVLVDLQLLSATEAIAVLGAPGSDAGPNGCLSLVDR